MDGETFSSLRRILRRRIHQTDGRDGSLHWPTSGTGAEIKNQPRAKSRPPNGSESTTQRLCGDDS